MDYFAWGMDFCLQGISAASSFFMTLLSAVGSSAYGVILALFIFAAATSLIILPLRGAALSDMGGAMHKDLAKSGGKYANGHVKWYGGSKGKYSK